MTARSDRRLLASSILSRGPLVNGQPVDADDPSLTALRERLCTSGVLGGDIVILDGLAGREFVVAALAAWSVDAVPMPVPAGSPVPAAVGDVCRIESNLVVVAAPGSRPRRDLDRTAVLHLSSGSTDQPKIARRSVDSVLLEAEGYRAGLSLRPDDRVAVPIPLAHSLGWGVAMSALISGSHVDVEPLVRAEPLARKLDSGAVSVVALTAPLARLLVGTSRKGPERPHAAMVGAGPVTDALNEAFSARFGTPLLRGYGSTETGGTFFGERGMGRPVAGIGILRPLPGECGELVLRLTAPAEGYLDDSEGPRGEWHTNDTVRRERDGTVHFVERSRGPLRLNGRFVDANAMARAVRGAPGVTDVYLLVLPRRETPEIEELFAVVEGTDASVGAVLDKLVGGSPRSPVPQVVRCARLPRNSVGKPDRNAVIDLVRGKNAYA